MSTYDPSASPEPNQAPPFYQPPESRPFEDEVQLVYQEVGKAYQNIKDFRLKLLGFLPFVTGSSFLLTLLSDPQKRLALEHLVLPFGF